MKTLLLCVLFSALFLWGCRNENQEAVPKHVRELTNLTIFPKDTEAKSSIRLRREVLFSDSLLLDEIPSIAVDDSGRVYFAGKSWKRRVVHVFEPDGTYRQSIGGYGEEDGKFLEISGIQIRGGHLYVFDDKLERATVFLAETGKFRESVNLTPRQDKDTDKMNWKPLWARNDGMFLLQRKVEKNPAYYPERFLRYFIIDREAEIRGGKILEQNDTRFLVGDYAGRPAPFTLDMPERSLLAISEQDDLYSAWTGEFLIEVHDADGKTLRAYYHPFDRTDLNRKEVIHPEFSHNLQLRRIRESAEYPEKWPALYSMLVDGENRIWVSTIIGNDEQLGWWIIDSNNTVFARFKWPRQKPIKQIKDGFVYTVETNSAGFKEVVRYRIEKEQILRPTQ